MIPSTNPIRYKSLASIKIIYFRKLSESFTGLPNSVFHSQTASRRMSLGATFPRGSFTEKGRADRKSRLIDGRVPPNQKRKESQVLSCSWKFKANNVHYTTEARAKRS